MTDPRWIPTGNALALVVVSVGQPQFQAKERRLPANGEQRACEAAKDPVEPIELRVRPVGPWGSIERIDAEPLQRSI